MPGALGLNLEAIMITRKKLIQAAEHYISGKTLHQFYNESKSSVHVLASDGVGGQIVQDIVDSYKDEDQSSKRIQRAIDKLEERRDRLNEAIMGLWKLLDRTTKKAENRKKGKLKRK